MAVDGAVGDAAPVGPPPEIVAEAKRVEAILSGDVTIRLNLEFLFRNNKTDLAILRATKTATETRVSALHSATVFANGLMHAGTSVDAFLRENLEWLARATNWAKFSAVATLGMIHKVRRGARRGGGGGGRPGKSRRALAHVVAYGRGRASCDAMQRRSRATSRRAMRFWRRTCPSRASRARRTRRAVRSLPWASSTPITAVTSCSSCGRR